MRSFLPNHGFLDFSDFNTHIHVTVIDQYMELIIQSGKEDHHVIYMQKLRCGCQ
jgi:hypothetical protein